MQDKRYNKPQVRTMTVHEILENLGPVSCGSGKALGIDGSGATLSPSGPSGLSHLN